MAMAYKTLENKVTRPAGSATEPVPRVPQASDRCGMPSRAAQCWEEIQAQR